MTEIDYSEFERYANEFASKYPLYNIQAAEIAMLEMVDFHLGLIPEYPEASTERLLPPDGVSWLHTDKQRRWFFAAVRSGSIQGWKWEDGHPKKTGSSRTGNLGRAQEREVQADLNDLSVIGTLGFDGTLAPYVPWVVGGTYPGESIQGQEMYQARIHVDRWWQFSSIINENAEQGWELFQQVFWEEFSKRVK